MGGGVGREHGHIGGSFVQGQMGNDGRAMAGEQDWPGLCDVPITGTLHSLGSAETVLLTYTKPSDVPQHFHVVTRLGCHPIL